MAILHQQHGVEPLVPLRACRNAQAAAACRRRPTRSCRPAPPRPWRAGASPPVTALRVSGAEADVVDHRTRREAGAAGRAQCRKLRPGLGQKSFRRLGALGLQLGHGGSLGCAAAFGQPRAADAGGGPVAAGGGSAYAFDNDLTGKRPCRTTRARTTSARSIESEIFRDARRPRRRRQRQSQQHHRRRAGHRVLRRRRAARAPRPAKQEVPRAGARDPRIRRDRRAGRRRRAGRHGSRHRRRPARRRRAAGRALQPPGRPLDRRPRHLDRPHDATGRAGTSSAASPTT